MARRTAIDFPGLTQRLQDARWWIVGAAFALGVLAFVVVWLADRRDATPEAVPVKAAAEPVAFEPLPRPMPAGARSTPPPPSAEDAPRLVEETPPAPPAPVPADTTPLPPSIEQAPEPAVAEAVQAPSPLAGQSPSPSYPPAAMRRRESGTVVVLVEVDASGVPVSATIEQRSGSRDLDRAAIEAVSGWRFEPARDAAGNPVAGRLSVPIDFKLE